MYATRTSWFWFLLAFTFISAKGDPILRRNTHARSCGPRGASTCVMFYQCPNIESELDNNLQYDPFSRSSSSECPYGQVCCADDQKTRQEPEPSQSADYRKCGKNNSNGTDMKRRTGADFNSKIGEFPWSIVVLERSDMSKVFCAGSLIHPSVVLAAAHNFKAREKSSFILRAGEWDLSTNLESTHQDRQIDRMVLHNFANRPAPDNDITLLFTDKPFNLEPNVRTVCLPKPDDTFDGATCLTAGWGANSWKGDANVIQKRVELHMIRHRSCQSTLRGTRLGNTFKLPESSICAMHSLDLDSCEGDGGAAVVCPLQVNNTRAENNEDEVYVQAGIVSWGIECKNGIPGVNTKVAHYRDWIDGQMSHLGTEYYTY